MRVWFQTPFGLVEELNEAVERVQEHGIDPEVSIVPVSVAVTDTLYEVCGH
jgi:hypothetical protein